jgi:hypothetical protein
MLSSEFVGVLKKSRVSEIRRCRLGSVNAADKTRTSNESCQVNLRARTADEIEQRVSLTIKDMGA